MDEKPKICVINLARRPDRWQKWVEQARKWQVPSYERVEGVDGANLEITPAIQGLFRQNDFHNNPYAIGCALSHLFLWMKLIETQGPYIVIFEDDAQFSRPFKLPELPNEWDLFYFGGVDIKNFTPPAVPYKNDVVIPDLKPYENFTTVAYMLSLHGALKLMQMVNKKGIDKHIDKFLMSMRHTMNVFCYSPMMVLADKSYGSDVFCTPENING